MAVGETRERDHADQVGRAVHRRHRRAGQQAPQGARRPGICIVFGVAVVIGAGIFTLTAQHGGRRRRAVGLARVRPRRRSPAGSPRCATPSSPPPCRWPAAPTRSPTRPSASSSPGSSAGTWCWSSPSAPRWWPRAGRCTWRPVQPVRRHAARPRSTSARSTFDWGALLLIARAHRAARARHQALRRVSMVITGDQGRDRAAGDRRRVLLLQRRELHPVHPAGREPASRRTSGHRPVAAARCLGGAAAAPSACTACSPPRRWSSSRSSASTSSPPRPRRRKNPQQRLPRGIFGSLAIVTVLYVAVALVLTGMVHYTELATAAGRRRTTPRWPPRSRSSASTGRPPSSPSARWPASPPWSWCCCSGRSGCSSR